MKQNAVAKWMMVPLLICACAGQKQAASDQAMQGVRDEISRVVPDAERRAKLDAAIDSYQDELLTFSRSVSEFQASLRALNARPDASRAEFSDLIAHYKDERKAVRARLVQIRHEMLLLTTEEEWRSIAKQEEKVLRLANPAKASPEAT